ncbi:Uncharacterised protein [Mycobacteroides abscessus subsp. massiliense]|nr:Uncharacterised protein [Mycobacteroides abscessus]SIN33128.1 Uncharacterised protein [Mycobacteroides abscessus subsp. bolletii]SKF83465.1 Uncharacterised protein [Mycobacteroides abscessus subsp. massiliense]SKH33522.1 Uncharacterised protein [Mycobacteroides abscessus subsp. massiliense]SKL09782.1 Uncharacterised protein [Mycobacteroides abscessus subsp. massiliense]
MVMNVSGWNMTFTPPASATSHSPFATARTARWVVTSEDEHAVSTVMLGPHRSRAWAMRLDSKVCEALKAAKLLIFSRFRAKPRLIMLSFIKPPMNVPTLPPTACPAIPASSSASHVVSRSSRCCGSSTAASRCEIPKKSASNRRNSCVRKLPRRVYIRPGVSGSGS